MVAELTSPRVLLGIAGGIALIVMLFVALAGRPRVSMPVVSVAFLVGAALVAVTVWAGFRGEPTTQLLAGGPPGSTAPPPQTTCAPPPPPSGGPGPACEPNGTSLQLTAKGIAFDPTCLAVPAGQAFTLTFDNQDAGTPHNVNILSADPAQDPSAQSLFASDLLTGVTSQTYDVTALDAGTYFFRCDVHPQQMVGTFVVAG
jgi:plastocyanin